LILTYQIKVKDTTYNHYRQLSLKNVSNSETQSMSRAYIIQRHEPYRAYDAQQCLIHALVSR